MKVLKYVCFSIPHTIQLRPYNTVTIHVSGRDVKLCFTKVAVSCNFKHMNNQRITAFILWHLSGLDVQFLGR